MALRAQKMQASGGDDTSQVLALSLFLMLLAFFIVLSTFSDFEENKVSAVQTSVEDTFSSASDIMGETGKPSDEAADDFSTNVGQAFDDIEAILKSQIGLISITKDVNSGIMMVSVPEDSIFNDHLSPYGAGKTLAGEIISIIKRGSSDKVRFTVQVNGHLDGQTVMPINKIKGLGIFARSMMQKGIEPHAMSIGLKANKAGYVDLVFNALRGPDKAHITVDKRTIQ